jgi:HAD superfamily hydrolase (TIGR01509 family)
MRGRGIVIFARVFYIIKVVGKIKAVILDWGDTVMRNFPQFKGPMVYWPHVEAVDGAEKALKEISRQFICCLSSNAGDSNAELMGQALERVGLKRFFKYLYTEKELGAAKPSLDFYRNILKNIGFQPGECIAVGNDYEKDIVPAVILGIKTVWLSHGEYPISGEEPDVIIHSMNELLRAIEKIQKLQNNN